MHKTKELNFKVKPFNELSDLELKLFVYLSTKTNSKPVFYQSTSCRILYVKIVDEVCAYILTDDIHTFKQLRQVVRKDCKQILQPKTIDCHGNERRKRNIIIRGTKSTTSKGIYKTRTYNSRENSRSSERD